MGLFAIILKDFSKFEIRLAIVFYKSTRVWLLFLLTEVGLLEARRVQPQLAISRNVIIFYSRRCRQRGLRDCYTSLQLSISYHHFLLSILRICYIPDLILLFHCIPALFTTHSIL